MKKYNLVFIYFIIVLLIACSNYKEKREPIVVKPGYSGEVLDKNNSSDVYSHVKEKKELTIWSFYNIDEEIKDMIHKCFPGILVRYQIISHMETTNAYTTAHNNGELPDILILNPILMGSFNSTNAFIDLADSSYNAEHIINEYPEHLKGVLRSLDGKKLIAMPVQTFPLVTFYRVDVMENYGFPTDPEELALYMENINNWLNMAKTFKENDQYMISWNYEPLFLADVSTNLFDPYLNFMRNTNLFINMLELGKTIDSLGLSHYVNLTDFNKESSIQTGKTIMFHSTISDIDAIKKLSNNESRGKWRVTRLPFGLYGGINSAVGAISSESSNKEASWAILEMISKRHIDEFNEIMKSYNTKVFSDDLFGDQDVDRLYKILIKKMPEYNLTPLDEKARTIWWPEVYKESSDMSIPAATLLNNWSQTVLYQLEKDIAVLKPHMKNK